LREKKGRGRLGPKARSASKIRLGERTPKKQKVGWVPDRIEMSGTKGANRRKKVLAGKPGGTRADPKLGWHPRPIKKSYLSLPVLIDTCRVGC